MTKPMKAPVCHCLLVGLKQECQDRQARLLKARLDSVVWDARAVPIRDSSLLVVLLDLVVCCCYLTLVRLSMHVILLLAAGRDDRSGTPSSNRFSGLLQTSPADIVDNSSSSPRT